MVLYTPLDHQDIFMGEEQETHKMIEYKGCTVYAREDETGQHRLVQLMSTNPEDFLDQELSPGVVLPNDVVHNSR